MVSFETLAFQVGELYDDLTAFISQPKLPTKAVLEDKLRETHRKLAEALSRPIPSPIKRATDFGRKKSISCSAGAEAEETPKRETNRDDGKGFVLTVEDQDTGSVEPNNPTGLEPECTVATRRTSAVIEEQLKAAVANVLQEQQQLLHEYKNNPGLNVDMTAITATHEQSNKQKQCFIFSDSSFRLISGYLPATTNNSTKVTTHFTAYPIGGGKISDLYKALHDGAVPVTKTDQLIIHCGANDVGVRPEERPDVATLKREYDRLIRKAQERFPRASILMSHIFPMKTGNHELRRAIQLANTAMDAAAAQIRGVRVVAFGDCLFAGDKLKIRYYENQRHLNAEGARYLSFRVREHFGFVSRPLPTVTNNRYQNSNRHNFLPPQNAQYRHNQHAQPQRTQQPYRTHNYHQKFSQPLYSDQVRQSQNTSFSQPPPSIPFRENASMPVNTTSTTPYPISRGSTHALQSMLQDFSAKLVDYFSAALGAAER
jgi:hypothetical protein